MPESIPMPEELLDRIATQVGENVVTSLRERENESDDEEAENEPSA